MTVCRSKKRYHWSKTCIICFSHHIPRLSADTCHHPFPCWHMTLAQTPPPGISWYMDDPLSYILYTKLPLLKLFSKFKVVYCAFCCFHNLLWMKYLYTELRVSDFQVLLSDMYCLLLQHLVVPSTRLRGVFNKDEIRSIA